MARKAVWFLMFAVGALLLAPAALAQAAGAVKPAVDWVDVAAALALGITAAGCGLGQGRATAAACEGTARNPGASGPIRIAFILGVALIESLTLYVLVVVLIK
ncbi:MAG: ATP synthase F0 subunit C [Candidatus Acidiferrales bacterium]